METYHKIQTLFKRDMDGSLTGQKGKMIRGAWSTPELEYLAINEWEFTEKVDGTNIRMDIRMLPDNPNAVIQYAGRTDAAIIPEPLLFHLEKTFPTLSTWRRDITQPAYTARNHEIGAWMTDAELEHVILFGEGYGPKIQSGVKYRKDTSFVLFDVKIGDWWLHRKDVDDIASKLGIDSVPVIGYGTLQDAIDIVSGTTVPVEGYPDLNLKPLKSIWGDFEAEGIVARPVVPMFDRKGNRIITKIKAVDFR